MYPWIDYQGQQWKYLFEITRAIASHLDLDMVLAQALHYGVDLVGGEAGLIALRGPGTGFHFAARYGLESRLLSQLKPLLTDVPAAVARDPEHWRFPELQINLSRLVDPEAERLRHVMAIPLIASDHLLGLIYVFRSARGVMFTRMDQDLLTGFADHVALAVEHARLYDEAARRARELAAVIEGSANGILIADREGLIRSVNRSLDQLTGWSAADAEGREFGQVLQVLDEHGKPVPLPTFRDGSAPPFSCNGLLKRREAAQGTYVHITLSPLYSESRQLLSIVGNVVDVSALKESEDLKTTFLAGISHDFKTPLALIRGYAETLLRSDVDWDRETLETSLAVIEDEAEYLTQLVNALLDAAQLEHGRLALQIKEIRLDELAAKTVERFRALGEGHEWALDFPTDYPAVPADPERIREVLQNLLNNATKYSPRGTTITVGGWTEPERVGVLVRDQGPGIPAEEQARIFQRFARGRGQSVRRAEGAGLGLYLCRAIVEQHGGRIWLENLPEGGAAFYFTLPRTIAEK